MSRGVALFVLLLTAVACTTAPSAGPPPPLTAPTEAPPPLTAPTEPPAAVCDHQVSGPISPPAGAVSIDPAVDGDLSDKTMANPSGTTFWLAPGRHTLGTNEYGQVMAKDGDTYLGAPGAILDGRGVNRYAFTQLVNNVTIRYLTVQGFIAPGNEGVVNSSSGDGWVVEHNTVQNNKGGGMMVGAHQQIRYNCLRDNGQYGINGYKIRDGISDLVVERNEVVGNNTDDWEGKIPGCGCTGGMKFWAVNGADIRANWIHDNHGPGFWADTNDNDFVVEGNLIEQNAAEAVIYEISYNLVLRANTLRNNTWVKGKQFADRKDSFPVGTIYLSEAGGEPRVPARTSEIEIYGNVLENNWSGITMFESANRFCNSAANTSATYCTRLVPAVSECAQPAIASKPLYDDCRWKTQRVEVRDNNFVFDPAVVGCASGKAGQMAVLSDYGTDPDWSPYKADVIQQAITFQQENTWRNNSYTGPWKFTPHDTNHLLDSAGWQADPFRQDVGSTFSAAPPASGC